MSDNEYLIRYFNSNFKIFVGEGSFGSVTKSKTFAAKKQPMNRYARLELKLLQTVRHDNVVRYLRHFEMDNDLVIIMELAKEPLYFWIGRNSPVYDRNVFLNIAHQLASGMAAIHEAGFIHRDLTPRNVLVKCDQIKICDFGLSIETSLCKANDRVGTYQYTAPEVLIGEPYDAKVDVWSYGCIMNYVATSKCLFSEDKRHVAILIEIGNTIGYNPDLGERVVKTIGSSYLAKQFPYRSSSLEIADVLGNDVYRIIMLGCLETDQKDRLDSKELVKCLESTWS